VCAFRAGANEKVRVHPARYGGMKPA
jgi:hypothetical protein